MKQTKSQSLWGTLRADLRAELFFWRRNPLALLCFSIIGLLLVLRLTFTPPL